MTGTNMAATWGRRGWIRLVIFVALYLMLLQSLSECALVLYLYGIRRVDGTMTPSLILGLVASFLSVPFVVLHAILAWHYTRMRGLNLPKTPLHRACSYLPRMMIVAWLASSVAGLVVVSKQATCHTPSPRSHHLWQAGISCSLHRAAVLVAVLAFITACALFFSFQTCDRPYDASLLGIYSPQRPPRDGSVLSESSWESETLKHEIFYLCRHPDAGPGNGELYWSPNDSSLLEQPVRPPSIRYPGAARTRPQLCINTNMNTSSIRPEITTSPADSSPKVSPIGDSSKRSDSMRSGVSPLSRNPSMSSSLQLGTEAAYTRAPISELSSIPDIPETPVKPKHERQKSSVSSRRFLPKTLPISLPLSEDPQIRALSSPPLSSASDFETQSRDDSSNSLASSATEVTAPSVSSPSTPATETDSNKGGNLSASNRSKLKQSTSLGDPPPVLPPQPLIVRKSRSSYIEPLPRSIHHPHHPNYIPPPPTPTLGGHRHGHGQGQGQGHGHGRPLASENARVKRRNTGHPVNYHHNNHNSVYHHHYPHPHHHSRFEQSSHLPRHTQSHHFNSHQPHHHPGRPNQPGYPRRFHSHQLHQHHRFDHSRTMLPPIPRSDEVAIVYPSTRRPRSSTYGGISSVSEIGMGIGCNKRATRSSLNLGSGGISLEEDNEIVDTNTYRGAERTSMHGL